MVYLIIFCILCAVVGLMIGLPKDAAFTGFFLGLLFGPLGLLIVALLKGDRKNCPHCDSIMSSKAKLCPNCREVIEQTESKESIKKLMPKTALFFDDWKEQYYKENPASAMLAYWQLKERYDDYVLNFKYDETTEPENKEESLSDSDSQIEERLKNLIKLHEKGLISEDELQKRRIEILDEI